MPRQLVTILALLGAAACGDDNATLQPDAALPQPDAAADAAVQSTCTPKALRTDLMWFGNNRADLTNWIAAAGCSSTTYDDTKKPIAMFDWDNTIGKNDFGDAITFYMIAQGKVLQPPNQDWGETSPFLTTEAKAALTAACGTTVAAGQPLPTDTNTNCALEMLKLYIDGTTVAGQPGFTGQNFRMMEPTYAWTAQLMAGYTHTQIQGFAAAAINPQLTAAMDSTQTIAGRTGLNAWLRVYDQPKDLIAMIQSYGYDVWIITASPQDVIQVFSPMVGIPADHVIGIRSKTDGAGKLTYKFEGCGSVADDNQQMIPYIEGKRCWVNKVIFGDTTATAIDRRPDGHRHAFAAGDSDTDADFVRDADQKLVLNRNKNELMCLAYDGLGVDWLINPMFIQPKAMKTSLYACSTTACKDAAGVAGPCHDDDGAVIADQADSVY